MFHEFSKVLGPSDRSRIVKKNNNNNNWFLYSAFLVWDTTQSALQCIITPVTGFNINPARIVHLLNSLGSILARCYFRGAHMPHHATNNVRILPGTHLYTWVESSNVDKVSCWRTKSARHWRESNPEPFDPESRVQSNIPRHLHSVKKCQEVSRIGYRSRQEVSRHKFRHTSCSNSYSGTGA